MDINNLIAYIKQNLIPEILSAVLIAVFLFLWKKGFIVFVPAANRRSAIQAAGENQHVFQKAIVEKFRKADSVDLLVIRGLAILSLKHSLFQKLLLEKKPNKKFCMRVLVLNPESQFAKIRAKEISEGEGTMSGGIRFSMDEILALKEHLGLNITIRAYDELPVWRYIFLDEVLYVSSYLPAVDGYNTAMHVLRESQLSHFRTHRRTFEAMWNNSKKLDEISIFTTDAAEQLMRDFGCENALTFHCKTVAKIALQIAINASTSRDVDLNLVEIGALLHDIGKCRSAKLDHAVIGADFIRSSMNAIPDEHMREKLARIIERHPGGGLTAQEVKDINARFELKIPVRNYIPESIEEKIVALADKMVEGNHEKTFEEQLKEKEVKFGRNSAVVKRIRDWHAELSQFMK